MWKLRRNRNEDYFEEAKKRSGRMKKIGLAAVGVIIAAGLIYDSFYQIQEQEQAVLVTFGQPKAVQSTGLHFKIPVIQRVKKVNTTIQGFPIGYTVEENQTIDDESIMITKDYNFINVDFLWSTGLRNQSNICTPPGSRKIS